MTHPDTTETGDIPLEVFQPYSKLEAMDGRRRPISITVFSMNQFRRMLENAGFGTKDIPLGATGYWKGKPVHEDPDIRTSCFRYQYEPPMPDNKPATESISIEWDVELLQPELGCKRFRFLRGGRQIGPEITANNTDHVLDILQCNFDPNDAWALEIIEALEPDTLPATPPLNPPEQNEADVEALIEDLRIGAECVDEVLCVSAKRVGATPFDPRYLKSALGPLVKTCEQAADLISAWNERA